MNKLTAILAVLALSAAIQGCSQQPKAASSQEAIQQSQAMKTPEEQVKYLLSQANSFVNSQQFEEGIKTAQHVLQNLDANSQEAKSIIEKATAELKAAAEKKIAEAKTDLTNKINSLGK